MYFSPNNCKLMQKWYFVFNVTRLQSREHWYYSHVPSHPPPASLKAETRRRNINWAHHCLDCQDARLPCLWLQRSIVSTWQWLKLHLQSLWFPRVLQSLPTASNFLVSIKMICKYLQTINLIDLNCRRCGWKNCRARPGAVGGRHYTERLWEEED